MTQLQTVCSFFGHAPAAAAPHARSTTDPARDAISVCDYEYNSKCEFNRRGDGKVIVLETDNRVIHSRAEPTCARKSWGPEGHRTEQPNRRR